jgi:hypothetical protein
MKPLLLILLLAFGCSEDEVSPCYAMKQEMDRAARKVAVTRGTDDYEQAKQEYLSIKRQVEECYSR